VSVSQVAHRRLGELIYVETLAPFVGSVSQSPNIRAGRSDLVVISDTQKEAALALVQSLAVFVPFF
jgi:hypothetical protein